MLVNIMAAYLALAEDVVIVVQMLEILVMIFELLNKEPLEIEVS